jgi:hypothetical protein
MTTVRHHTRRGGDSESDGPQEKFLLTVRRRSGRPVNPITGAPEDTIMVHGRADLERRLAAAAADPDYEVSYEEARASAPMVGSPELAALSQPAAQDEDWWADDEPAAGDLWADEEPPTEKRGYTVDDGPPSDWAMEEARRMIEARERDEEWVPRPRPGQGGS